MFAPGAVSAPTRSRASVRPPSRNWLGSLTFRTVAANNAGVICVNDGLGSPIVASKVAGREAIVGLPKASTMRIGDRRS